MLLLAYAQIHANLCKHMQIHVCFFVSGCWQVCSYDVVRSNSKTVERAEKVKKISAFLKSFCSSLLNSCLNSPGLQD